MINCIAYDVEVLRNFFSVTFVSINSYLKVFKDCVNADNKAIPLVQKLSVEEIKARLKTVEKYKLIDGTFSVEEAEKILTMLFNYKIDFHNREDFSNHVRFNKNIETLKKES